jgi:ATP-dependent RNA helicase DDX1
MAGGFASLGLLDELVAAVQDFGWTLPTDIQDETIPLILGGGDVMASAPTGSGKTAAFALPVVQACLEAKERDKNGDKRDGSASATFDGGCRSTNSAWRVSNLDRDDAIAIEPNSNGLLLQSRDPSRFAGCRSALGIDLSRFDDPVPDESWSFSCQVLGDGIVRVGYATADASLQIGTDGEGWGYGSTGVIVHKKEYVSYGVVGSDEQVERVSFGRGDVIGCHLRIASKGQSMQGATSKGNDPVVAVISYSKNGLWLGDAFEIRRSVLGGASLYPSVCLKSAQCRLSFGVDQPCPLAAGLRPLSALPTNKLAKNPRDPMPWARAKGPLAIVLEPTRDLAEQTFRVFEDLASRIKATPVRPALLVGGVSPKATLKMLDDNKVDILVGTVRLTPRRCRFWPGSHSNLSHSLSLDT